MKTDNNNGCLFYVLKFSNPSSFPGIKTVFPIYFLVFELLERGEVLMVPTDSPLEEQEAWITFRDVILGLEYRNNSLSLISFELMC